MSEGFFDFYELRNDEKKVGEATFAAVDLETTGLYPETDAILEVGVILFKNWSVLDTFHSLVDPGMIIPEASKRIHGITDLQVKGQPRINEILPGIRDFIGEAVIIAHNVAFDMGFLRSAAEKEQITLPAYSSIDTCELARKCFPGQPSYSLQNLASHFGIAAEDAHRAVDDARVCMQLFEIECEKIGGNELPTAEVIRTALK